MHICYKKNWKCSIKNPIYCNKIEKESNLAFDDDDNQFKVQNQIEIISDIFHKLSCSAEVFFYVLLHKNI